MVISRGRVLFSLAGFLMRATPGTGQEAPIFDPGPALGEKIPPLEVLDQDGRVRTFNDLRGPAGLLLLFHRSADW